MDLNVIIHQMETGEQDVALKALQSYNKEVNIIRSLCIASDQLQAYTCVFKQCGSGFFLQTAEQLYITL